MRIFYILLFLFGVFTLNGISDAATTLENESMLLLADLSLVVWALWWFIFLIRKINTKNKKEIK